MPEEEEPAHLPPEFSPQGTTVSFDGTPIGYLTGFDSQGAAGQLFDATGVDAPVVGSGSDARVVRQYDCTSIEPMVCSFNFFGPPSFTMEDSGRRGALAFDSPGSSISGEAILISFNHAGNVGRWTTGSASFQLTGAGGGT